MIRTDNIQNDYRRESDEKKIETFDPKKQNVLNV